MNNKNKISLRKGEWKKLTSNGEMSLWDVTLPCGETHEVVTARWLDNNFIVEVDGISGIEMEMMLA